MYIVAFTSIREDWPMLVPIDQRNTPFLSVRYRYIFIRAYLTSIAYKRANIVNMNCVVHKIHVYILIVARYFIMHIGRDLSLHKSVRVRTRTCDRAEPIIYIHINEIFRKARIAAERGLVKSFVNIVQLQAYIYIQKNISYFPLKKMEHCFLSSSYHLIPSYISRDCLVILKQPVGTQVTNNWVDKHDWLVRWARFNETNRNLLRQSRRRILDSRYFERHNIGII